MNRVVDPTETEAHDPALRPRNLREFVGQKRIVENLRVYIKAALQRGEPLSLIHI